ncbi:pyruvate dehydrogenase complex dihydrolipoyllysine-residue acetyltransferase [Morganella morganii]|uniref:pyruvate dehydrogenase complex dihydrolipoyllysine-residue acetyltransferase n=1 Tax=Morganella morganii TaxID=582 RepID=UPI0021D22E4C|nr:pyruvate dehydrogenase complex dihydrolipoyllysine-residue acetyltransferase [Morganella morganii]ELA9087704.1 pyruvate dehydrogenase complex dihydrolipoyllysine-residue acetyltransferase [Morganella morganii]MCU6377593.1 pyruvate dehydrogenase complex dihydrolipoyllysine-residue acetyltransferase [Morganella morganii]HEI9843393.1 pyruvate dehydrogenase complex dihydrolipoyllysine-residue acetyltransferase [Morganella morganii]
MSIEIHVPDIGSDEVDVTEILVSVGDKVEAEQSLITVEGDKASMEVPSPQAGVVKEIKVAVGDKVSTGSFIMVFEAEAAAAAPAPAAQAAAPAAPAAAASALKEVHVPDIGGDEVDVTEIMVSVGDTVTEEQSLITVEGDKASMEVPSPMAGVVKEIKVAVGDKVSTGSLIMVFEVAGAAPAAQPAAAAPAPAAAAPAVAADKEIHVPDIGGDEVDVTEIMVSVGDTVTEEQSLITVEGDKASMEVPSPMAGKVKEIKVAVGDKVKTGSLIMVFEVAGAAPAPAAQPAAAAPAAAAPASAPAAKAAPAAAPAAGNDFVENDAYVHASPVIRRLAREFGVNLAKVKGTGRKGRILREDVQAYVKDAVKRAEAAPAAAGGGLPGMLPWPKVDFSKFGEVEEVELSRIQKLSGANLSRNWVMIPHVTLMDEADITDVEEFRKQQNKEAEKKQLGVKITPLVFVMKAAAKALVDMPRFNSSITEDAQRLILKKYVNIGIAVDTPNGLVVPVIKDVNKKGILELSYELAEISKKARNGKLTSSDMQGGCFTISSLGGIGTTGFAPIVNAPEVAIMGLSRSSMKPVWDGKQFVPRLILPMSLSFDHRVIDGADGARFITLINQYMSDLRRLAM